MPVRIKIIISLLALTGSCLAIYIWIAKNVFENDKVTTTLQAASIQNSFLSKEFERIVTSQHQAFVSSSDLLKSAAVQEFLANLAFSEGQGGSYFTLKGASLGPNLAPTLNSDDWFIAKQKLTAHLADFEVTTAIPKSAALKGLNILYLKSMQFFCLVIFIVLGVAILMTRKLLRNLDLLTETAGRISRGQFDYSLNIRSQDEFGKVAGSFQHMSKEIQRLLSATKEKARMEFELKTAQTIQENLFPETGFHSENLVIEGLYRSASECGGDWWYQFQHPSGVYVIICDATGHGAAAALITAAAKAAVNLMKRSPQLDIQTFAEAFNYAIYETAKGNILMTGFVVHIKNDSSIEYINASHEPPVLLDENSFDYVMDPVGPRFGQSPVAEFEVGHLAPRPGQWLLLYTDGITSQVDSSAKAFGDRRFNQFLKKSYQQQLSPKSLTQAAFETVDAHRGLAPLGDDLTIVAISFSGDKRNKAN